MSVGFTADTTLLHELMTAQDERRLFNLRRYLSRVNPLMIIDEYGVVSLSSARTGAGSIFGVFSPKRLTGAPLGRLTHCCTFWI